jgi:outer membrane protein assembly factor BamB
MSKLRLVALLAALTSVILFAADWPMRSGGPQRNGWAKSESRITKANIASLQLLYRYQAENPPGAQDALTSPIVNGNLITYRGFKEMLIFSARSDKVFSVDADLNKLLWKSDFEYRSEKPQRQTATATCPGGLTSPVLMAGSSSAPMHFAAMASRIPAAAAANPTARVRLRPSPYFPPLSQSVYPLRPNTLRELAALYTVSSDGDLHIVNSSTGGELIAPFRFLPPNANVTSMNIRDNVVYATTANNCDGYLNALYAVDLLSADRKVSSFPLRFGGFAGSDGTAVGDDGTVYVQAPYGEGDSMSRYHEAVLALTPKDLKVKDYFLLPGKSVTDASLASPGVTPMVFSWKRQEFISAADKEGRLYLLDAKSLGGADHRTPLFQTDRIASRSKNYDGNGFRGAFSSWNDVDTQNRWIYVPISGPLDRSAKLPLVGSAPETGSIAAFKIDGQKEKPELQPLWVSADIPSPAPVVIANGIIFALSTGESPRVAKKNGEPYTAAEREAMASHAVLYGLDALIGRQLYSSGNAVSTFSHAGGLAVANGRVYFAAHGNAVYCFGFPKNEPQLAEQ